MNRLRHILEDFVALALPRACAGCEETLLAGEETLCTKCRLSLPRAEFGGRPFDNPLAKRLWGKAAVGHVSAFLLFKDGGTVQRLVHRLKYERRPEIGVLLGRLYGQELQTCAWMEGYQALVPVPLHPKRQRERGYNQSERFAYGIGQATGLPVETEALVKVVHNRSQVEQPTRYARWENVKEAFEVRKAEAVRHRNVLLVDDTATTGATLEACANRLLEAGCTQVGALALGMAV